MKYNPAKKKVGTNLKIFFWVLAIETIKNIEQHDDKDDEGVGRVRAFGGHK